MMKVTTLSFSKSLVQEPVCCTSLSTISERTPNALTVFETGPLPFPVDTSPNRVRRRAPDLQVELNSKYGAIQRRLKI